MYSLPRDRDTTFIIFPVKKRLCCRYWRSFIQIWGAFPQFHSLKGNGMRSWWTWLQEKAHYKCDTLQTWYPYWNYVQHNNQSPKVHSISVRRFIHISQSSEMGKSHQPEWRDQSSKHRPHNDTGACSACQIKALRWQMWEESWKCNPCCRNCHYNPKMTSLTEPRWRIHSRGDSFMTRPLPSMEVNYC